MKVRFVKGILASLLLLYSYSASAQEFDMVMPEIKAIVTATNEAFMEGTILLRVGPGVEYDALVRYVDYGDGEVGCEEMYAVPGLGFCAFGETDKWWHIYVNYGQTAWISKAQTENYTFCHDCDENDNFHFVLTNAGTYNGCSLEYVWECLDDEAEYGECDELIGTLYIGKEIAKCLVLPYSQKVVVKKTLGESKVVSSSSGIEIYCGKDWQTIDEYMTFLPNLALLSEHDIAIIFSGANYLYDIRVYPAIMN